MNILKKNICENCKNRFVVEVSKSKILRNKLCPDCRKIKKINKRNFVDSKLME